MKSSLFSALLGLIASVAGTPVSTSDGPPPSSLADNLDDGGYYPDPGSDTPWNGTVISPDERDLDWTPDEAHDSLTKRHPNWFTFYRRDWFYTSCSNPSNCQNYQLDHIQVHNDCNGGNCNGDYWRDTDWDENLCDKSFKSCGKTYTMGYTGKEWSCARLRHFIPEGAHHGRTYANLMAGGRKVGTCKVFNKKRSARSCDAFAASSFWSMVQCQIY